MYFYIKRQLVFHPALCATAEPRDRQLQNITKKSSRERTECNTKSGTKCNKRRLPLTVRAKIEIKLFDYWLSNFRQKFLSSSLFRSICVFRFHCRGRVFRRLFTFTYTEAIVCCACACVCACKDKKISIIIGICNLKSNTHLKQSEFLFFHSLFLLSKRSSISEQKARR